MGTKSSLSSTALAPSHVTAAWKNGRNISGLIIQAQEAAQELIALLRECVRDMVSLQLTAASNPSTSSPNITMAGTIPASVIPGMTVFDATKGASLGTVSSGAGTTTLVLAANSLSVGSGTSDTLTISDPNIAAFNTLIANLS